MSGRRALVTRPDGTDLCARLRAAGWDPLAVPTVAVHPVAPGGPLDGALQHLGAYDWVVVTSAAGVRAVFDRLQALGLRSGVRARWAAVGPATDAALEQAGVKASFVPRRYETAAVSDELDDVAGRRILLLRADAATPDLPRRLRARGALVDEVVAYHTVEGPEESRGPLRAALAGGIDAVLFTSGSTVRGFARLVDDPRTTLRSVLVACIGPVTARAVQGLGVRPDVVAEEFTTQELIAALGRGDRGVTADQT